MSNKKLLACASLLAVGMTFQASAQIYGLYNTGVDNSGTPLADGTIGDPHYTLAVVPSGPADLLVRTSAGGFPIPPYIPDDSVSAWIIPNGDGNPFGDDPSGSYDYQTTFTSGSTLEAITGQVSSDNELVNVLLNGHALGIGNPDTGGYAYWTPFTIGTTYEVPGVNTLDFIVNNDEPGATGLRAEFTVPDSSLPLSLLTPFWGLALWGASLFRRKSRP